MILTGLAAIEPEPVAPERIDAAYRGLPVSSLEIEGVERDLREPLRSGLALAGRRRTLGRERALLFPETLEQDLARCRLFLARHGYPAARVIPEIRAAADGASVRITLRIAPGSPVRIREVVALRLPDEAASVREPRAGDVFRDAAVRAAADDLETRLRDRGYAFAEVQLRVETVDSTQVDVILAAEPGTRYRVDHVRVEGVSPDLVPLVKATPGLRTGRPFSPARLREAEVDLRELELFRQIRLDLVPLGEERLEVRCDLSERPPRTLTVGVGYFSDERFRLETDWVHRNLLGGGRGGRVAGRFSEFLQTARTELLWPRLWGTRTRGAAGLAVRREDEEAYLVWDVRLELTARRRLSRVHAVTAGIATSYVDVESRTEDPAAIEEPAGFITALPVSWTRDTSDHPIYPKEGSLTRVQVEVTPPGIGSVAHYARGEAQASLYRPAGGTVLAARALLGAAHPLSGSETVLASKRLFSGGSRSMRGFGRRELGPRDADGDPLGGEAKVEASLEWRFPVFGRFEAAVFVDAGQVWSDPASLQLADLRWAAGPAAMVRTPVGPLRLDLGFLFDPGEGESRRVLHFSVGHPY
jgi:outer membrane protein assembly complex protein YaeT